MKLTVAGKQKEYAPGITVKQLLELEHIKGPEYVTVSLNDSFVKSGAISDTVLNDGDNVEFLYFMGGGESHGLYQ